MMGDLNSALTNVYNHLNAFTPSNFGEAAETLQKDNLMLKGMQEHSLDAKGEELAKKINVQLTNLQVLTKTPSLGAQQMTVSKFHKELKETRDRIKDILKRIPRRGSRAVEKTYKSNTQS